jgi:hypothetical protein
MTKASFSEDGLVCWIDPDNGTHELPVESMLPHRFKLVEGVVVDKYEGVTDQKVREIDHEEAMKAAAEAVDGEGNPTPFELPPLDYVAPLPGEGDN